MIFENDLHYLRKIVCINRLLQCGKGRFDFWRDYEPEFENKTHTTTLLTNEAIEVINRHAKYQENTDEIPIFLYLAYNAPHDPLLTDPVYDEQCKHIPNRSFKYLYFIMD